MWRIEEIGRKNLNMKFSYAFKLNKIEKIYLLILWIESLPPEQLA